MKNTKLKYLPQNRVIKLIAKKEINWFCRKAENGKAEDQYMLGECFYYGYGVEQNRDKGLKLLFKAAQKGNFVAIMRLNEIGIDY